MAAAAPGHGPNRTIETCFATSPPVRLHAPLSLGICVGHALLYCHERRWQCIFPACSKRPSTAWNTASRAARFSSIAGLLVGIAFVKGVFLYCAALDSHRHLARDRIRYAQRPLSPARKAGLRLLPALPHRRHHGPHDKRLERRPQCCWARRLCTARTRSSSQSSLSTSCFTSAPI